ncbi:MAG: transglycosylase SLT domain-containing protein [Gemmatimonadota bacterium]
MNAIIGWIRNGWRGALVALIVTCGAAGFLGHPSGSRADGVTGTLPSPLTRNREAIGGFERRYGISSTLAGTIYHQARELGVQPGIVFELIRVESQFDPRAIGSQGERGLMQIKPATARAYDRQLTPHDLMDPAVNVRIGLRHLLEEVGHFEGDWTLGLQAYHRGRTGLRRALASRVRLDTAYADRILAHCDVPPS